MATVVNTPSSQTDSGMGFFLGALLLVIFLVLFFIYGIPYLSNVVQQGSPQINVPSQLDVNVKQGQ